MNSVFVVLHYNSGERTTFTGYFGGVDFHQGRGSTSSFEDVARLVDLGHRAEDPLVQARAEAENARKRAEEAEKRPSQEAQAYLERLPGYVGTPAPRRRRRG